MKFEDVDWHDQVLMKIEIDQSNSSKEDVSLKFIVLIHHRKFQLQFVDVYNLDLRMNFGIVAEETINYGIINTEDNRLLEIIGRWARLGVDLYALKCFEFNTASTNSTLKVYAKSCKLLPI
ncbi:hypothetical protein IM792_16110 [Mucilaginibacter sp. JRF]|uniref:hypothetical protein n=1 Tax=Mucilaginibacter sp. JRF TaxID=2780088 RepID=UPI0018807432|nr:hypothetical protein [Mucilaginibacter sp. JRF]MBE9585979.1 hypothetical protein [Mucilaginibacter sp. JRF]